MGDGAVLQDEARDPDAAVCADIRANGALVPKGQIALMEQPAAQLALPRLHVGEFLRNGKRADTGPLPDDGDHLHPDVDVIDADDLGGNALFFLKTPGEGAVGAFLWPARVTPRRETSMPMVSLPMGTCRAGSSAEP